MPVTPIPAPPVADGPAATPSLRTLGTAATQAAAGNDARFLPTSAPALSGTNAAVLVEVEPGATLAFRQLTLDDIAAAFTISSFAFNSVTNPVEIGVTVTNPAFTASYNRPAALVKINDGVTNETVTLPATSFAYNAGGLTSKSYSNNTINASQSFTLNANEAGGPVKSAGLSISWQPKIYYGVSTDPGVYTEAFVEGFASSELGSGRQRTKSFNATAGLYMWFLYPDTFGGSSSNFIDTGTGFAAGFSKVGTVNVTANTAGAPTNLYAVWRSDVAGLGLQTIQVT